jgi:hypothetical protein
LVYADPSSTGPNIVLWTAIILFGSSFACLIVSFYLRWIRKRTENKQAQLEAVWRPILYAIVAGTVPSVMPTLRKRDVPHFGVIWLNMYQRLRGDSAQALLDLLLSLGITQVLPKLLSSRNTDHKLIAFMLMTALKDERATPLATTLFDHHYYLLSHTAAKMLMVKTPEAAIPMLLSRITQLDWPIHKINTLLNLAPDREQLAHFLSIAIDTAPVSHMAALLEITFDQTETEFGTLSRQALKRFPDDADTITSILQLTNSYQFLPLAAAACRHRHPAVRCAGLKALINLGSQHELTTIELALNDDNWEVQHHAALAMIHNPAMTPEKAQKLLQSLPEGSARLHLLEAMYHKNWLLPENWYAAEAV